MAKKTYKLTDTVDLVLLNEYLEHPVFQEYCIPDADRLTYVVDRLATESLSALLEALPIALQELMDEHDNTGVSQLFKGFMLPDLRKALQKEFIEAAWLELLERMDGWPEESKKWTAYEPEKPKETYWNPDDEAVHF